LTNSTARRSLSQFNSSQRRSLLDR
jgi:hypothetical protein